MAVSTSASAATATTEEVNRRLWAAGTAMPPRAEGRGAGKRARPRSDADAAAEVMNGEDVATFRARFSRADSRARGSWDERGARAAARERASAERVEERPKMLDRFVAASRMDSGAVHSGGGLKP